MLKKLIILVIFLLISIPAFAQAASNPDSIPFTPPVNYGTGGSPASVVCADIDGDGDLDLVVANDWSYFVSILKNKGDGTFEPKVDYQAGLYPMSVFCADLDGDGDKDLAVANWGDGSISILKNNGNGTFQPKVDYAAGSGPYCVFCADLDGDGDKDLAVANNLSNTVCVFKNNGNGTFQPKYDYSTGGSNSASVFCADVDGDGDLDLAVGNASSFDVSILKNNGNGTFQPAVRYGAGGGSGHLFCADLDGDSDIDLVIANYNIDNISVLKNNSDGTFQPKVDYATGNGPDAVFCADLDGDGDKDLAVANQSSNNVSILKNNGDGTFRPKVDYTAGVLPSSIFSADLDGDGDFDLAVANQGSNTVSILKNLSNHVSFQFPVDDYLNSICCQWKWPRGGGLHVGEDVKLNAPGTPVYAMGNGIVKFSGPWKSVCDGNWGTVIVIEHTLPDNSKICSIYGHVETSVNPGQQVTTGQQIAIIGNFYCPGPKGWPNHLHFGIYIGEYGKPVGVYPGWLHGYLPPKSFPGQYRQPSDYIQKLQKRFLSFVLTCPASMLLITPSNDTVSVNRNTSDSIQYTIWDDIYSPPDKIHEVLIPDPDTGLYKIFVLPDSTATDSSTFSLYRINESVASQLALDQKISEAPASGFVFSSCSCTRGNVNGDSNLTVSDVVYLVNYLFKGGPIPVPNSEIGDCNCDGQVTVSDVIYLINYLFKGGPSPNC